MLEKLTIRAFKSLEDVTVDLGLVNVFIGANGSGKSNLLEALGTLGAAADGKADERTLLARGVRPGLPALYRSAFSARKGVRIPRHLSFGATGGTERYEVSLHNPLKRPEPAWRFRAETWEIGGARPVARSSTRHGKADPYRGLAALRAVEIFPDNPSSLLGLLQDYVIFSPATAVLRGVTPESRPAWPVGLSGGNLPRALLELLRQRSDDARAREICRDALGLVDWGKDFGAAPADRLPLTSSAAASRTVIRFRDRFMREGGNMLSGYEASEGALFVLFLAVLAAHRASPRLCAVDDADHGLNPRLARTLMEKLCQWYLEPDSARQILLTTHNPLILDGLRIVDDRVRLFVVSRTGAGRTAIRRIAFDDRLPKLAEEGWTLSRMWTMGYLGDTGGV